MSGKPSRGSRVRAEDIHRWGPVWSRRVGWFLAHAWWNTTVHGAENVPRTGPVVVASNHTGVIDGPLLHGVIPRGSHFIIKQEFWDTPLGFLMTLAGQIPVDRSNGRAALAVAQQLLHEGRVVGIFPEGNRGRGRVESTRAGVAWLAVHGRAPVVPVACLGTRPSGKKVGYVPPPRARLHVVFGKPLVIDTERREGGNRELMARAMKQIHEGLAAHVEDAVHLTGVPLPSH
ncbi:lysophospholipid acyltransferase family protein [uncultured Georgenia sp.]|uniref:lysophospholipid acyltransferase family protein n=1 Tax=uncultured Georgenia sp. TaxID=378209 RepID=UPI0026249AE7|nr:lysophospholipid acyltransferase family protein [uncultured Georgenia sp.]HLV03026.1 lysophospholipid acyltransferase family protein [Actinomycetaceae bacterium]